MKAKKKRITITDIVRAGVKGYKKEHGREDYSRQHHLKYTLDKYNLTDRSYNMCPSCLVGHGLAALVEDFSLKGITHHLEDLGGWRLVEENAEFQARMLRLFRGVDNTRLDLAVTYKTAKQAVRTVTTGIRNGDIVLPIK